MGVALSDIITAICERAGLSSSDLDVSELAAVEVAGYVLNQASNGRGAIDPLRMVGQFDVVESEGKLKFRRRGGVSAATLTDDDLGAFVQGEDAGGRPPLVSTHKAQDAELPRLIRLRYVAIERDYEPGEQLSPSRFGTPGVNEVSVDLPIVLTDQEAAQAAEVAFREAWASRFSHKFSLDTSWHALEPADVVTLPVDGRLQRVRVVSIQDAGLVVRQVDAVRDDDGSYASAAVAIAPTRPAQVVQLLGGTAAVFLDLPALTDADDDAGFYLAAYRTGTGQSWGGANLYRSVDGGVTYQLVRGITAQATVGTVVSAPADGDGYTWDDDATIEVDIVSGSLSSLTDAAVLAGGNMAAMGAAGRWQLVQFAGAQLIAPGRYRLRRLLLGRRGTEAQIGATQVGDTFVLVSGSGVARLTLQSSEIGASRVYRPVTIGASFDAGTDTTFTGQGGALECFSPVHVRGARDGSGNLTVTWIRRDRLSATLRDGVTVPNSEAAESYEVDVLDGGGAVVRTISGLSSATAGYSAADQSADFGSAQAAVTVRVYQLSATVGRGAYAEATV